jgi:hypothetical protein
MEQRFESQMWDLLAVRFIITADSQSGSRFHVDLGPIVNRQGNRVFVYEQDSVPPYVRVVPAAAKCRTTS